MPYLSISLGNLNLVSVGGSIECSPLAKSAPVLQILTFWVVPINDNYYLYTFTYLGAFSFQVKNDKEKVIEVYFWGRGHFRYAKTSFPKPQKLPWGTLGCQTHLDMCKHLKYMW